MAHPDPYPSRTGAPSAVLPRQDPVIWGHEPGPLVPDQLADFAERGFLLLPSLLSRAEVAGLLDELARLVERDADPASDEVIVEPGSAAIRSIFRVHRRPGPFARLAADPRLAGAARQILGGDVYVHQSRLNLKPGFTGRPFSWHSDFETWHVEDGMPRMRALSASVLLTLNTAANGPLMLIPGSHRAFVACEGRTPADHFRESLRDQRYGVPPEEAIARLAAEGGVDVATGPPGTVVLFDCNVLHASAGNLSPFPRHNVFLVYNSVANRLVAPFGGQPPRPAFLGERDPGGPAPIPAATPAA